MHPLPPDGHMMLPGPPRGQYPPGPPQNFGPPFPPGGFPLPPHSVYGPPRCVSRLGFHYSIRPLMLYVHVHVCGIHRLVAMALNTKASSPGRFVLSGRSTQMSIPAKETSDCTYGKSSIATFRLAMWVASTIVIYNIICRNVFATVKVAPRDLVFVNCCTYIYAWLARSQ